MAGKKEEEQGFAEKEKQQILGKRFVVYNKSNNPSEATLEEIINSIIEETYDFDKDERQFAQNTAFKEQVEDWKEKKQNKDPSNKELAKIIQQDLLDRMVNTMLTLQKDHNKIFDNFLFKIETVLAGAPNCTILLKDKTCIKVFNFCDTSVLYPARKPFFMKNPNDNDKLNGVCIYKCGNKNEECITACFKDRFTKPKCEITFKTDENNKITNVEIETDGESTCTISLNKAGNVEKITKRSIEVNDAGYKEINNLLFKDETHKHLTENIECELDSQQKAVFDEIKKYIGVDEKVEEKKKEEENINTQNEERKKENSNIHIEQEEESPMCNCGCWNNLKSWCSKLCLSGTTMD